MFKVERWASKAGLFNTTLLWTIHEACCVAQVAWLLGLTACSSGQPVVKTRRAGELNNAKAHVQPCHQLWPHLTERLGTV